MKSIESAPQFSAEVLASDIPVLVDFWSEWCAPCKVLMPVLDELEPQYAGRVKFVKLNSEHVADIARRFHIRSLPTVLIFKGGAAADSIIGIQGKAALVKALDRVA